MPYIGNANVRSLGKYKAQIRNVALDRKGGAGGDAVVIGLPGDETADIRLPVNFPDDAEDGSGLGMEDLVSVRVTRVADKLVSPIDTTPAVSPNAPAAAGAYAQADVQAMVTLTNELKAKVNGLLADLEKLHTGAARDLSVTKGGLPFQIVVSNLDAVNGTPELEIEITYAHSRTR